MHNEREIPNDIPLSDAERRKFSPALTGWVLGIVTIVASAHLADRFSEENNSRQPTPSPSPSIRVSASPRPEFSLGPEPPRGGTLTITKPDGTVIVERYGGDAEPTPKVDDMHADWQELQRDESQVPTETKTLPAVLAEFQVDGHMVTIHPKRDADTAVTGLVRLAVAADGADQHLLDVPSREGSLAVPQNITWQWNPETRTLTVTFAEWNVERLTYRWKGQRMMLIDYDMYQPGRDDPKDTSPAEDADSLQRRIEESFASQRTEFRQGQQNAQILLEVARTGNWQRWAKQLKQAYPARTEAEITELVREEQEKVNEFAGIVIDADLDPTYFYLQRSTIYVLTDARGNTLPLGIKAGPGGASFVQLNIHP